MSRLAEAEWIRACEDVRKSAPSIGTVGEWRALCEGGWTSPMPGDLPDLGINDGVYPRESHAAPNAQTLSQPTAASFDMGHLVNTAEAPESPTSPPNLKLPNPIRKSSEDQSGTDQPGTHTTASRSPSPLTTRDPPLHVVQKKPSKSEPDPGVQMANEPENTDPNNSSVSLSTRSRGMDGTSSKDSSAFTGSATYSTNVELPVMDTRRRAEQPDLNSDHSTKLELGATQQLQSMTSSREYLPNEGVQLDAAKKHHTDLVEEREAEEQYPASPDNTRPESGRDVIVGGGVTRRLSVESSSSLVAAMRERYDSPSVSYCVTSHQYTIQMLLPDEIFLSATTRFASYVPEGVRFSRSLHSDRAIQVALTQPRDRGRPV